METSAYKLEGIKQVIPAKMTGVPHEGKVVNIAKLREKAAKELAAVDNRSDEEKAAAFTKMKEIASFGGVAELQSLEGDYYNLAFYRDSMALDFVEMRDLPLGTIPIFRTRYPNPVGVFQGGLAGHGSTNYYATADTAVQVTPFTIQTEEVQLPNLNNIYDMEKLAQRKWALQRMNDYMDVAIHNIGVNTMFGAADIVNTDPASALTTYFSGGGSFSGKSVYTLDPGVLATGVPTLNVYDKTAEGGLTKAVFQTINTHSIQIGRRIRKIYVPNAGAPWEAMQNQASVVALSTGQGNQNPGKAVTEEMWSEFQRDDFRGTITLNWFGLSVQVERQNWLPQGYCIVLTDEPAVIMWDRLSLESGEMSEASIETPVNSYYSRRSIAKNVAFVRPDFGLRNFLVVKVQ